MGMMSEIATESALRRICQHIATELRKRRAQPDAVAALKAVGLKALEEFEWDTPEWAAKYDKAFRR